MKKIITIIIAICLTLIGGLFVGKNIVLAEEISKEELPELYIKAINPGYTIDGKSNVGEMIEIGRTKNSDAPISLAGITVHYTNSSGNTAVLVEFPEHSWFAGETILLRLSSSPNSELAAVEYTKTLALKGGPLEIKRGEDVIDSVCWNGKDECYKDFKSANPTVLVRNLEINSFEHLAEYVPVYDEKSYYVDAPSDEGYGEVSQCKGMVFSEILSFYESSRTEQFVELYNSGSEQVLLNGCQIKYKNKYYPLEGIVKPEGYFARFATDFGLTKNPNNFNVLELIDANGEVLDKLEYPNGQRRGTSYMLVGYDASGKEIWKVTYAPTPGEANNYQEFKTCEEGKVLNEVTGNCVKVTSVAEKICPEGQYLNILTGRCRKIPEATTPTECKEGYYLNEETGRCKKIQNNDGADYNLAVEKYEESSSFVALYAVLGVLGAGIIYIIVEFRREIVRLFRKVFGRFH